MCQNNLTDKINEAKRVLYSLLLQKEYSTLIENDIHLIHWLANDSYIQQLFNKATK
jgi:hypothetical protein